MTRRDLAWRGAGLALTATACAICVAVGGSPLMVLFFPLVFLGLPLMLHGKRVAQSFRAERRGHCHTAGAVHAARVRRRGSLSR
ncbi:hypothetical protein ACBY01_05155 [Sphingomonas sp. ac-8]|uniref:hypothetical protein n=1 Tax=Sphingomonas sp. ac-8 TaxID=3242977 RepID=UPI003A7F7F23